MRFLALPLLLSLPLSSCSQHPFIKVENVWARDTAGRTANAAVFMTVSSNTPDRLIAASTRAAKRTDLMTIAGGSSAMEMTYVKAIDIPANTPVSLNAGGLHVWLADLKQPLRAGQSFPLLLEFEKAGERRVVVSIIEPAAPPPASGMRT